MKLVQLFITYLGSYWLGSCNPNSCPDNQVCIGHKDGTSSCKCIERKECPKERDLICGTDGRPYLNECIMKAESCSTNTTVGVKHQGACGTYVFLTIRKIFHPFSDGALLKIEATTSKCSKRKPQAPLLLPLNYLQKSRVRDRRTISFIYYCLSTLEITE